MHYFLIRILSLAAALLAICCILSGIPACDKDTILRHYDNALQVGGALARTPDAAYKGSEFLEGIAIQALIRPLTKTSAAGRFSSAARH